nr:uncharacterized protein LOC123494662 [Aegilops tauschii subsp. strangulata]
MQWRCGCGAPALDLGDGGMDVERHQSGGSGAAPEQWSEGSGAASSSSRCPRRRLRRSSCFLPYPTPVTDDKCKKKAPRIIHKAEREKHKRDLLNDLFSELDEMLV